MSNDKKDKSDHTPSAAALPDVVRDDTEPAPPPPPPAEDDPGPIGVIIHGGGGQGEAEGGD